MHPRRGSRGDGSMGPPNRAEQELRDVCRQIAELAPQKFTSVREAFRYLRPDHNGRVSRSEVCYFFRAYGIQREQADRLFAYFNPSDKDDIECQQFVEYFRAQVNTDLLEPDILTIGDNGSTAGSMPGSPAPLLNAVSVAKIANDFHYMLEQVREKAPQKFSHVREALRLVDGDYDGCITQGEMRHFFRAFSIDEMVADKFFFTLAKGGPGGANYNTFVQVVGPFLDLPGVVAHTASAVQPQSRPQSARSRPSSGPSRPQSADRRIRSAAIERPATPREVLEEALSIGSKQNLPVLACEEPLGARLPAGAWAKDSVELAKNRPASRQLSARRSSRGPRGSSVAGDSPRLPPAAASPRLPTPRQQEQSTTDSMSSAAPQGTPRVTPRGTPRGAVRGSSVSRQPSPAPTPRGAWKNGSEHIEKLIQAAPKGNQAFEPACPPPVGRGGRRPMGVQGVQRAMPVARAPEELKISNPEQFQKQFATALTQGVPEPLQRSGRPVATPKRPSESERSLPLASP